MMFWLSKHTSWTKAREVEVSTRQFGLNTSAVKVEGEDDDLLNVSGRKLSYLPTVSNTHSLWHNGFWITVNRLQEKTGWYGRTEETLQIRLVILLDDHSFALIGPPPCILAF
jgi:mitochondrial chaperone BCS1